jgi:hypothetical protein
MQLPTKNYSREGGRFFLQFSFRLFVFVQPAALKMVEWASSHTYNYKSFTECIFFAVSLSYLIYFILVPCLLFFVGCNILAMKVIYCLKAHVD